MLTKIKIERSGYTYDIATLQQFKKQKQKLRYKLHFKIISHEKYEKTISDLLIKRKISNKKLFDTYISNERITKWLLNYKGQEHELRLSTTRHK